jgi:hypothetical protein
MRDTLHREQGQALVLFTMLLAVFVILMVLVIDGGFFMVKRREAQNVVDAAALAGAQELPDDPLAAEQIARDYAVLNGYEGELIVNFQCTSTLTQFCNPGQNKYDTIIVQADTTAPVFFGPILNILGSGDSCWTEGCTTRLEAGACRGACGSVGSPVDVVMAIDHTGSMRDVELQNAKDGAKQLMTTFDASVHRIGLAVTPPIHANDPCDTVETWNDSDLEWLPIELTDQYQSSTHVLDNSSALVSEMNCLDLAGGSSDVPGPHTDLAEPMRAAMDELLAHGRDDVTKGIVLLTDGAANVYGDPAAAAAAGALGPCDYAYKMATQAKSYGFEVYTIGYGVDENCTREQNTSPWYNRSANELLRLMATDNDHFYNQPRTADLDPVFKAIGAQLAGGSKLVK